LFTGISVLGVYFFALPPLSLGRFSILAAPCTVHARLLACLFYRFVGQFSFGCFSLAQEISSMIHYLPGFVEWLITCPLSAFAAFSVYLLRIQS
jgi:hypothetical protein